MKPLHLHTMPEPNSQFQRFFPHLFNGRWVENFTGRGASSGTAGLDAAATGSDTGANR